jgi:GPH family glycoside/pentoside/hexuronide:cation symporter
LLAYYGFVANVEPTAFAQNGIQLMLSVLPTGAAVISVIFISFYPLSEEKLQVIEQDLNDRRNKAN